MGLAMLKAHEFGAPLRAFEELASACPRREPDALVLPSDDTAVPPCLVPYMASSRDLCVMRLVRGGKIQFKPNALWSERVCTEAQLNQWRILPSIVKYIQRSDLPRWFAFVRRTIFHGEPSAGDGSCAQVVVCASDPTPFGLRVRTMPPTGGKPGFAFVPHRVSMIAADAFVGLVRFEPLDPSVAPCAAGRPPQSEASRPAAPEPKRSRKLPLPWGRRTPSVPSSAGLPATETPLPASNLEEEQPCAAELRVVAAAMPEPSTATERLLQPGLDTLANNCEGGLTSDGMDIDAFVHELMSWPDEESERRRRDAAGLPLS